ncbi:MAG: crossover junction endodeoxyribonuclease RuvC [Methanophagales archaeon]|nr:crossover junction endodeoxyribonuclease RuvC [Methanophagales archaeon]
MRVIGIDPGTARTGWGVVEFNHGTLKSIDFGCIKTTPRQPKEERLKKIYEDLLAVIKNMTPDDMAIEKIFFNINVKTALNVGQARGVCLLAAAITGLPAYEYNTSEVKSIITGYGRATKSEVASKVKELLRLEETPKPDDVTDALAIAATHIFQTRKNSKSQAPNHLEENHQ